jgi:hypothetical protein
MQNAELMLARSLHCISTHCKKGLSAYKPGCQSALHLHSAFRIPHLTGNHHGLIA